MQEAWQISNESIFKWNPGFAVFTVFALSECDFKEAQRLLQIIKVNIVALVFSQNQQKCN